MGMLSVKMIPDEIDSLEHKDVKAFFAILKEFAQGYDCKLTSFAISKGMVIFSFDSEEAIRDFGDDLEELTGCKAEICDDTESFVKKVKEKIGK